MHKSSMLMVAATAGSILTFAGSFDTADAARITLGMCIRSVESCRNACKFNAPLPPPWRWNSCYNRCTDNHRACVDQAMEATAFESAPKGRPKRPPGKTVPPNILGDGPGFSTSTPSATGKPGGAAPSARPATLQ